MISPEQRSSFLQKINAALGSGEPTRALSMCSKLTKRFPTEIQFWEIKLQLLLRLKKGSEAILVAQQLLQIQSHNAIGWIGLGRSYVLVGQHQQAEGALLQGLKLDQKNASGWFTLGQLYRTHRDLEKASLCLQNAYKYDPTDPEIITNIGLLQYDLGHFEDAAQTHRAALQRTKDRLPILINLGNALRASGELQQAIDCFDEALTLNEESAVAKWNRSMVYLLSGEYELGFATMDSRVEQPGQTIPDWFEHRWNGQDLPQGTLLVESEQGFGDLLQFGRFIRLASQRVQRVVLRCHPKMQSIMSNIPQLEAVCSNREPPPKYDARIGIFSLPNALKLTSPQVNEAYLSLSIDHSSIALQHLKDDKVNIGIAWQGNPNYEEDHHRSVPLRYFLPLLNDSRLNIVSLQKFHGLEQMAQLPAEFELIDLGAQMDLGANAFEDTAKAIQHLDLIISSDTSIVHLAGAMGVATWVLLPFAPDWRWELKRDATSWYPSLKLFRQRTPGNWEDVVSRVHHALDTLTSNGDHNES